MAWEELRREARYLENQLDAKLVSFSKLGSSPSLMASPSSRETRMDGASLNSFDGMTLELQELLLKLSEVNDRMSDHLANDSSTAMLHTVQRHRDIYNDYKQDFGRTQQSIRQRRDREDLLGSVQRQIHSQRSGQSSVSRRQEMYMQETDRISGSHRLADDAINIAMSAKEALLAQGESLKGVSSRMGSMLQRFPVINNVIQKAGLRKRRDSLIMGSVISVCIIFILWYTFR